MKIFDGGLLCARRHSEATPAMKPSAAALLTAAPPPVMKKLDHQQRSPASTTIPVGAVLKNIILKPAAVPPTLLGNVNGSAAGDLLFDILHSGERIRIGHPQKKYEYVDSVASFIGRGSYGIVYKGIQRVTKNAVAIKKMWRINVKPDELEAMKCVRNEHLVSLMDVIDEPTTDITYLVMEFCDTDLDRYLRFDAQNERLQTPEMMTVVESIARGYYALYQKHIVHRDIKPQNVLLVLGAVENGGRKTIKSAKITDFGVSRVLADETIGLCNVAGTLFYMAPEVGANLVTILEYNAEVDMWSIGVLFYQCHTGIVPFDEPALCRLFLHCAGDNYDAYEPPELPVHGEENRDPDFGRLITALLEIDPQKRLTPVQLYNAVVRKNFFSDLDYEGIIL